LQDGIASPDDVDSHSQGLGLRYSFIGPFETMHLNADGVKDYCKKCDANVLNICESQSALDKQLRERYHLNARRKWRDSSLAAIAINRL